MRIVAFRGEKNVESIVDKHYGDLSATAKKKAVDALVKANPQLTDIRSVSNATLLRVPDVPTRRKVPRSKDDPATSVLKVVDEALDDYGDRLLDRCKTRKADLKDQGTLLKNSKLKKVFDAVPELAELAEAATKATSDETSELAEREKQLKAALKQLAADLEGR
jgi:phage tail protein X